MFLVLLASAPKFFFMELFLKDTMTPVFYVFTVAAGESLITSIVFISRNYKKPVAYDAARVEN